MISIIMVPALWTHRGRGPRLDESRTERQDESPLMESRPVGWWCRLPGVPTVPVMSDLQGTRGLRW